MPDRRRGAPAAMAAAILVAVVVFAFRYLSNVGFSNDHFVHLARAQQMLLGGWPVRDFEDPGMPLMYLTSAAALRLSGHNLFGETLLVFSAFAVAAALTVWLAWRSGAALAWAVVAALLQAMIMPRSYSYPKLLLYAVGIAACWRLVERVTIGSAVLLGVVVATAFLFRHDHGVFIGAAGLLAVVGANADMASRARLLAVYVGTVAVLLAPWALYVEATEGLTPYVHSAVEFSRTEAAQTRLIWPRFRVDLTQKLWTEGTLGPAFFVEENSQAFLFYGFLVFPVVMLLLIAWRGFALDPTPGARVRVAIVAVLALLISVSFLRDPLEARLPDVAMPQSLLAAWALTCGVRRWRSRGTFPHAALVAATVTVLVLTTVAVNAVGNSTEQLDRIGPLRPTDLARRARAITHALRTEHDERAMPSPASMALRPVYAYVQACTLPSDRLMYVGFGPEIYFYAHRGFAAGQATYLATYYSGADDQRRMRDRLARERTPVAIMPEDNTAWFARTFPLVNAELRARYRAVSTVDLGRGERGRLLVDGTLPVRGTYGEGGWPCFR